MTLGERILQKRKECGLSQESLGEKLDVTRQTVYKWESDQAIPELDKLIKLAQIFGVGVGWLVAEEESDQKEQAYMEAAQKIAALLAQSQAPQPAESEQVNEAVKASTSKKINWFQGLVAAALVVILVVILAVGAFKFASIDREITNLENTNLSSFSASSQNEEDPIVEVATGVSGPGQDTQSITVETELTVYTGPSTTARLAGTIAPGETVKILRTEKVKDQLWGYIQYQSADSTGSTGWVKLGKTELNPATEEATEASQPEQVPKIFTTETELTVYSAPSTTARLVGTIPPGKSVVILRTEHAKDQLWGYMQNQQAADTELTGWVNLDKTALNPAAEEATQASQSEQDTQHITSDAELTVYTGPSTKSRMVSTLNPGETVEILKAENVGTHLWGYIQYQSSDGTESTGWIILDNMELNPAAKEATGASQSEQFLQVITTETELTVYAGPSTKSRMVSTLNPGETVEILKAENVGAHLWGYIQYQSSDGTESTGWIILDNMELNPAIKESAEASQPEQGMWRISSEVELTVYVSPSTTSRLAGTVAPGETAEILKTEKIENHVWGFIQYQQADGTELTGWVNLVKIEPNAEPNPAAEEATEASQPEQVPQVNTTETELTVYTGPSTTARLAGTVAPGETVEILKTEKIGSHLWGFIQYQQADGTELTGWINLDNMEKNLTAGMFAVNPTE